MAKRIIRTVEVPEGVTVEIENHTIKVSGSGKEQKREFKSEFAEIKKGENGIDIWCKKDKRNAIAECGTVASHIKNMISGLNADFEYKMEVVYSHFPMTVTIKGNTVEINNLAGAKKTRVAKIVGNTKVEIKGKDVTVKGLNKEHVGQTAANIEQATKIRGKDIRVYQDGVYITEKPGKI